VTVVDYDTGEIVSRAVVIPKPADVVDVYALCLSAEAFYIALDDVAEVYDAKAKFAGIDTYMAQKSKDGRARIGATMRRLETHIGELIGPSEHGGDRKTDQDRRDGLDPLTRHERAEFRLMAAHPDIVEAVISEADDNAPPSRKKILGAIRVHKQTTKKETDVHTLTSADRTEQIRRLSASGMTSSAIADELGITVSRVSAIAKQSGLVLGRRSAAGMTARVSTAKAMAAEGHTSRQIADAIGITFQSMGLFRRTHDIKVPADQVVGRSSSGNRIDSVRVVVEAVKAVQGIGMLFPQIDYSVLPHDAIDDWVSVLDESITSLTTLRKNLNKEKTQQ
jgi:DNA-binding CsgD family transcriptional regulator